MRTPCWPERSRNARAALSELDLAERRHELVNVRTFHDMHVRISSLLRRAGEQLQRTCGAEAWAILDEALVAAEAEMNNHFETEQKQRGVA